MVPEATMSVAAFELRTALLLQIQMKKLFGPVWAEKVKRHEVKHTMDGVDPPNPWEELSLSFFAVMGGFRVVYSKKNLHPVGVAPAQEGQQEVSKSSTFDHPVPAGAEGSRSGAVSPSTEKPDRKDITSTASSSQPSGIDRDRKDITSTSSNSQPSGIDRESPVPGPRRAPAGFLQGLRSGTKDPYDWSQIDDDTGEAGGTLTPHGVLWMARKGWLPVDAVSPEFVRDKSKVNALAKILVCFQAGWMIVQAIGRFAAGQEVTLLELHTVLHALCAGTMYMTACCSTRTRDVHNT